MMSPGLEELVAKTRAAKSPLMFLYHGILEKPPLEVFLIGEPEPHNRTGPLPPRNIDPGNKAILPSPVNRPGGCLPSLGQCRTCQ